VPTPQRYLRRWLTALLLSIVLAGVFYADFVRRANVAPSHDASEARIERALAEQRDLTEFVVGNMLFVGFHVTDETQQKKAVEVTFDGHRHDPIDAAYLLWCFLRLLRY